MTKAQHRWSGWPGAWCLDCGAEDPVEAALAHPETVFDDEGMIVSSPALNLGPCPEPGSKRHDPYAARIAELSQSLDEPVAKIEAAINNLKSKGLIR